MSDHDEFMETATGIDEMKDAIRAAIPSMYKTEEDEDRRGRKKPKANLTQYADFGGMFAATAKTIPVLPSDAYTLTLDPNGNLFYVPQKIITDDLLRLPDSKSEEVVEEVERFWTLKDKFKSFGFAHKRGFLLWGPPGSGKTSTVSIILNDMVEKKGIVFIADNPFILQQALKNFRTVEMNRPLVVIWEDIDAVIRNYGEHEVLSILDGETQVENVVFIATTNYPEKLDGRVINRPSRFDKVVKIGLPNAAARKMYLEAKVKETVHDGVDLVKETNDLSIAHIKELIVNVWCQGNDVRSTLKRLQTMKRTPKSDDSNGPLGIGS
jgi:hypothetical protein